MLGILANFQLFLQTFHFHLFFLPTFIHTLSLSHSPPSPTCTHLHQVSSCACAFNEPFFFCLITPHSSLLPFSLMRTHLHTLNGVGFCSLILRNNKLLKLQWCVCSILILPLFNLSCACQIFSWVHFIVHRMHWPECVRIIAFNWNV